MVFQLIYHSRFLPIGAGPSSTIRSILRASAANNLRDGLTGFLIFDKSHFVQVLEGDQAAVLEAYERIGDDPRHAELTLVATRQIVARAFADWAMGGHLSPTKARISMPAMAWPAAWTRRVCGRPRSWPWRRTCRPSRHFANLTG